MSEAPLKLFYAPRTRAFTALWLLEELGVPYEREDFDIYSGRHKRPDFLALNPMGKVPLVVDRGRPVAELGAIAIYLADVHPESGLAPPLDSDERPHFLRWAFFSSAILEPALAEKFLGFKGNPSQLAWGSFDQMLGVANAGVSASTWLTGETFRACDVLVGSSFDFAMKFGAIPKEGPLGAYVERATARPAYQRAVAIEAEVGAKYPQKQ
jgi:glutathione S-transferase